jgi:septal ring factor EnvC (AmiA/AmiB activator)
VGELANRAEELWGQMDKLWASAWRRNQKDIKDLSKVVEDNRTQAQSNVNTVTASVKKSINRVNNQFDALQNDFNATKNEILSVSLELETMKQGLLSGQDTYSVINEKIAILEQRNTALRNKVAAMEKTLNSVSVKPVPSAG